jgi:hypothetical protein
VSSWGWWRLDAGFVGRCWCAVLGSGVVYPSLTEAGLLHIHWGWFGGSKVEGWCWGLVPVGGLVGYPPGGFESVCNRVGWLAEGVLCELDMAGDNDGLKAVICLLGRRVWDGQGWPRRSILRGIFLGQLGKGLQHGAVWCVWTGAVTGQSFQVGDGCMPVAA